MDNGENLSLGHTTTLTSEPMAQGAEAKVNYSRWMTDIGADIAHLKLHQLALPSAHNAGIDKSGTWGVDERWGACQNDTFSAQLNQGVRVLDLRLVDASYKKTSGRQSPTTTFIEVFLFKHSVFSAGRQLKHCIGAVKDFVTSNPGEIVILDFHSYALGNHSGSSVDRCLPYFNPIRHLLIPPEAADLSIAEIRQRFPNRSVIIAWGRGNGFWGNISHKWTGKDLVRPDELVEFANGLMNNPPAEKYWSLSATAFVALNGPIAMPANHELWNTIFKPGRLNCNIVNVDFFENTGVVDRCIDLCRARGLDKLPPTVPAGLTITQLLKEDGSGGTREAAEFKWTASTDDIAVREYHVYQDDRLFFLTGGTKFSTDVRPLPYQYKICAVDSMGNISGFSSEVFSHLKDDIPPTKPGDPWLRNGGLHSIIFDWDESSDSAGISGYEIKVDKVFHGFTEECQYKVSNLNPADGFQFELRAKDFNNNYSVPVGVVVSPRPIVPKANEISTTVLAGSDYVYFSWSSPNIGWMYSFTIVITLEGEVIKAERIAALTRGFSFGYNIPKDRDLTFGIQYATGYGTDRQELSEVTKYTTKIRAVPLNAPADLKGEVSSSYGSAILTWSPSSDARVAGYAISCDEAIPVLVPALPCSYVVNNLDPGADHLFEVWAVDDTDDNPSLPISIVLSSLVPPTKPGTPVASNITDTSAVMTWVPSTDNGGNIHYRVNLNGFLIALVDQPHFSLTHLRSHTEYRVEVRAVNAAGISEPASRTFRTELSPPENLRFSHLNGICRLAWDPVFGKYPSHEVSINDRIFTTGPGRWGYNFRLSDLSPGPVPHHFKFVVRAQLDGSFSKESRLEKTLSDGVPPSKPGAPVVSDITDTSAVLTWEPSSDNVGVTGYRVVLNGLLLFFTPDARITLTGLASGAYCWAFVRARDKDGNFSERSGSAVFKTTGQAPVPPPLPPYVDIAALTSTSARLEWSFEESSATGARIIINDEFFTDALNSINQRQLKDLIPNVEYSISVSAFDIYGQLSEPTTLVYEPKDVTPPSVPGSLRESELTFGSVTLNWEASTDDIGVLEYVIYNNHEYFDSTPLTHYTAVDLLPGSYSFEVCAMDLSGNASEPASITVKVEGKPTSAPSNFRVTQTGLIPVPTLEWDAPGDMADIIAYRIILTGPQGTELPYDSVTPILKPVLLPKTRYDVRITARNAAGHSLPLIAEMTTR